MPDARRGGGVNILRGILGVRYVKCSEIALVVLSHVAIASAFHGARAVVEKFFLERRPRWPSVPRLLWTAASRAPRRRLHHCRAAAAASRHAAPPCTAVTKLDDALPHGLQHRCESRFTTPAPHLSNRPSRSASRRRLPLRGAPCTQLLPARLRASASRWACTLLAQTPTAGQLSGRARGGEALRAAQRRPKKKLGLVRHRENQIGHGGRHQSVLRGKPFL